MQFYARIWLSWFVPVLRQDLALLAQAVPGSPICKTRQCAPHLVKHLMARLLVKHLLLNRLVMVRHLVSHGPLTW